eukprot:2772273-Pyramimonas_sp.AAC.1
MPVFGRASSWPHEVVQSYCGPTEVPLDACTPWRRTVLDADTSDILYVASTLSESIVHAFVNIGMSACPKVVNFKQDS